MRVEITADAARFLQLVTPALERDPLHHTVIATVVSRLAGASAGSDSRFRYATAHNGNGTVAGFAMYAGPGIYLGTVPGEAVRELARALAEEIPDAGAVEGAIPDSLAFAEQWTAVSGERARRSKGSRLYRLGGLRIPEIPGYSRPATESDIEACTRWNADMDAESAGALDESGVRARIAVGALRLWIDGERPVSMAGHHPRAFGWSRIGPVYTPPADRGHGYAGAATADLAQRLRASGSQVCLFTDPANPTSNKIYRSIGFEAVREYERYEFTDPAAG
ncbi:hypothetical protein JK358_17480 [Nocardia sp. 2]|uniref:N-acetyltransferase domain-containing protein n=1 Tax=Nocardia acididurans TaxID=2802282 RepID=A0ABS1MAI9_9NOCA|nr:GNAT family N-acetyltransferase [Nocardia acididurans]MBL1076193.1 hypothetical protein [Nocardia acididurans]